MYTSYCPHFIIHHWPSHLPSTDYCMPSNVCRLPPPSPHLPIIVYHPTSIVYHLPSIAHHHQLSTIRCVPSNVYPPGSSTCFPQITNENLQATCLGAGFEWTHHHWGSGTISYSFKNSLIQSYNISNSADIYDPQIPVYRFAVLVDQRNKNHRT